MNPTGTGLAVMGGTGAAETIIWLFQVSHVTPPSAIVAGFLAGVLAGGLHQLAVFISTRFPPKAVPALPAPAPVHADASAS